MRVLSVIFLILLSFTSSYALSLELENALVEKAHLFWLAPTFSAGLSYNEVSQNLTNDNSEYYGLRFAKPADMEKLISEYYLPINNPSTDYKNEFASLYNDFSVNYVSTTGHYGIQGWVERTESDWTCEPNGLCWFEDVGFLFFEEKNVVYWDTWPMDLNYNHRNQGFWLVSEISQPVPEPPTFSLFGCGIAGLAGARKKLKK